MLLHTEIERPHHSTSYRIQRFLPVVFLVSGLPMFIYGVISLAGQISSTSPIITAKLDLPDYKIDAKVNFQIDQSDLQRNAVLMLGGLFLTALGTGMQLGMMCPIRVHRIASIV